MYKCREGRLDYRGLLSFAAIAVPMTIILMNEFIGDAILDAVIPGIYAAILVAAADLFAVSLLALVLPLCAVVGLLCYLVFVYRPARTAHNRRQEQLKRVMGHEPISRTSQFRPSGSGKYSQRTALRSKIPSGYFRRVLVILKHELQDCIARSSCGESRLRGPRKYQIERDWCNLNMPASSQGIIVGASRANVTRRPSLCGFVSGTLQHPTFLPPIKISDMMTALKWKAPNDFPQKGLTGANAADFQSVANQLVVTRPGLMNNNPRKITSPISFDPSEILTRIRTQLMPSDSNGQDVLNTVRTDMIFREFEKMLDIFYPDGIPLTGVEKAEAIELFIHWKTVHCRRECLVGEDEAKVEMISFQLFEKWFYGDLMSKFQRNMPERLIDHTLHCAPNERKRLLRVTSSSVTARANKLIIVEDVIPPISKRSPTTGQHISSDILSYDNIYSSAEDIEAISRLISQKSTSSSDLLLPRSKS